MPAIFNEDEKTQALLHKGKTLEDARRGCINGCVEVVVQGKDMMASSGYFNMPKSLELALNDGVSPLTGTQLGPRTGSLDELTTLINFLAVRAQMPMALSLK
jgi:formate C-acetyltransferase